MAIFCIHRRGISLSCEHTNTCLTEWTVTELSSTQVETSEVKGAKRHPYGAEMRCQMGSSPLSDWDDVPSARLLPFAPYKGGKGLPSGWNLIPCCYSWIPFSDNAFESGKLVIAPKQRLWFLVFYIVECSLSYGISCLVFLVRLGCALQTKNISFDSI